MAEFVYAGLGRGPYDLVVSTRLETGRLVIRTFEARDTGPWLAMVTDPEVRRFLPPGPAPTIELAQRVIAERQAMDCGEAARYLEPVIEASRQLAADKPEVPRGFAAAVMARVRADPQRTRRLILRADPPVTLAITEHAAAAILSGAADTVPGITSRGCQFPEPGDPSHLEISVSVLYGLPVSDAFDALRKRLRAAAARDLGVELRAIDITLENIHTPDAQAC